MATDGLRQAALGRLANKTRQTLRPLWYGRLVRKQALTGLIWQTGNFGNVEWLGHPIWQNPLDAWVLQEAIVAGEVDLVVECGTNRGGSALYMASIFDCLGRGHVITIDIAELSEISHPRIEFVRGSSTDRTTFEKVVARIEELQPKKVMVLLDSDHSGKHVLDELKLYSELVDVGGYISVQDGCIDELRIMRDDRPGPRWAIRQFVAEDRRFEIDVERSARFLYTHSPSGWLRRAN